MVQYRKITDPMNQPAPESDKAGKAGARLGNSKGRRMLATAPNGVKDRQALKIKELAEALVAAGFESLDDQADALGLSRSTTWTILKAKHKNYGLSAAVINRVLRNPDLNSRVRAKVVEYIREKTAGSFGHNHIQLRRFVRQLVNDDGPLPDKNLVEVLHPQRAKTAGISRPHGSHAPGSNGRKLSSPRSGARQTRPSRRVSDS
jgi:hypothetical protein